MLKFTLPSHWGQCMIVAKHVLPVSMTLVKHALSVSMTLARFVIFLGITGLWGMTSQFFIDTGNAYFTNVIDTDNACFTGVINHGNECFVCIIDTCEAPELSNNSSKIFHKLKSFLGMSTETRRKYIFDSKNMSNKSCGTVHLRFTLERSDLQ